MEKNEDTGKAETSEPENGGDSLSLERHLEEYESPELIAKIVKNKVDVVISMGAGDSPVYYYIFY